jgi:heterodisulfide reductase subunit A-like polyferredoxin
MSSTGSRQAQAHLHSVPPGRAAEGVLIDPDTCIEFKSGKMQEDVRRACAERNAIDFKQKEEIKEIEVGTIILATGFKTFDPQNAAVLRVRKVSERLHFDRSRAPRERLRTRRAET